jgi:hypothetical protein
MYEANLSTRPHSPIPDRFRCRGWEVQRKTAVRVGSYNDWHRVERARSAFQIAVLTLRQDGWTEQ